MGTVHQLNAGATLTQLALANRFGKSRVWIRYQGERVKGTTQLGSETWQACRRRRNGNIWGYSLLLIEQRAQ